MEAQEGFLCAEKRVGEVSLLPNREKPAIVNLPLA